MEEAGCKIYSSAPTPARLRDRSEEDSTLSSLCVSNIHFHLRVLTRSWQDHYINVTQDNPGDAEDSDTVKTGDVGTVLVAVQHFASVPQHGETQQQLAGQAFDKDISMILSMLGYTDTHS